MEPLVAETKVLAIASHVVYGYVGNTMAALVMQTLGCDVAALNTVQFSNHTGYRQFKGTRASADEIEDIYAGLKQSNLTDFDVLLSGYSPNAHATSAIGIIAKDLKIQAASRQGAFFWVLDPVMGDEGRLYVNEDVIPVYKDLLGDADLILPNQYELELLSDMKVTSVATLQEAIAKLHMQYHIPHIIVTSVSLPGSPDMKTVVGSSVRSDLSSRLFQINVPAIDCFFSGTGDMFAALTVVRLREAVLEAGLDRTKSWLPADSLSATELPLAKAVERVLGSMHAVLTYTKEARDKDLRAPEICSSSIGDEIGKAAGLRRVKAAEIRVVRCLDDLKNPKRIFKAELL